MRRRCDPARRARPPRRSRPVSRRVRSDRPTAPSWQAFGDQADHGVDLGGGGRAGVEPHGGGTDRAVGDEGEDVEGRSSRPERVEVAADRGPADADVRVEVEVGGRGPDLVEVGLAECVARRRDRSCRRPGWCVPWVSALGACGEDSSVRSLWVWMSTNPGVTTRPVASMTVYASSVISGATATTRSPSTAISAARGGAPVPSTRRPPRTRRSITRPSPPRAPGPGGR